MNINEVNKRTIIKIFIIIVITSLAMLASSIIVYSNISKPKYYEHFINIGNKYLLEAKYEESIVAFDKAIKIEPKSTEARIGSAQGYIGNNDIDKGIDKLKEAQEIDIENIELLMKILDLLKDVDGEVAYEILNNYINKVGKDNLSDEIKEIIETANQLPKEPIANPNPGKYITPVAVKLQLDKYKIGHSFYYTIDRSDPNKESEKYRGSILIDESTEIKVISYNSKGESTEVISLEYEIDNEMKGNIESKIKECKTLRDNTTVGNKVGNCIEGSQKDFTEVIKVADDLLKEEIITYESAESIMLKLDEAIEAFKSKIIEETDREELKNMIDKAQNIHDKAVEGNKDGLFEIGSKNILLKSIKEAEDISKNILSRQANIDYSTKKIKKAIDIFNNSKNQRFTHELAMQYFTDYFYEKPYRKEVYGEVHGEYTYYNIGKEYNLDEELIVINGKEYYEGFIDVGSEGGGGWQRLVCVGKDGIVYEGRYDGETIGKPMDRNAKY